MTNFIAFLLTKGKEVSFLSALQKEQKNKTIVSTERRLLNIYILLLFKRHFDAGLGGGGSTDNSQTILLYLISEAPLIH